MPEVQLRKRALLVEEIFHEGGPAAKIPLRRAAALSVIHNPFAGKYVEEIAGFMETLNPLGLEMARALLAALGGDPKSIEGRNPRQCQSHRRLHKKSGRPRRSP